MRDILANRFGIQVPDAASLDDKLQAIVDQGGTADS
jgi:hypothetical protein